MGHSCGTLLWDTVAGHSCGTLLWDTLVCCGTLLWDTLAGHSCRDTLVGHSCRETLVGHFCRTLLRDTHTGHSLWDTHTGHSCGTLLTRHSSYETLLRDKVAGHSCGSLLWDDSFRTRLPAKSHTCETVFQNERVRTRHSCGKLPVGHVIWDSLAKRASSYETLLQDTVKRKHSCRTFLQDALVRQLLPSSCGTCDSSSCGTLQTGHSCWDTLVVQSCNGDSYATLLWDTLQRTRFVGNCKTSDTLVRDFLQKSRLWDSLL